MLQCFVSAQNIRQYKISFDGSCWQNSKVKEPTKQKLFLMADILTHSKESTCGINEGLVPFNVPMSQDSEPAVTKVCIVPTQTQTQTMDFTGYAGVFDYMQLWVCISGHVHTCSVCLCSTYLRSIERDVDHTKPRT